MLFILSKGIVDIVGSHQLDPSLPAQTQKSLVYHLLLRQAVVLQLQKEIVFSEYLLIPSGRTHGLLIHSAGQIFLNLSRQAGTESDDSLVAGFKNLVIHSWLIVKSLHKSFGNDLHEVFVALIIFRQQHQMVVAILSSRAFPVKTGAGSHIDLAAQNRLDPRFPGCPVKINNAVHNAVIRNGQAVHSQFLCPGRQLFYLG